MVLNIAKVVAQILQVSQHAIVVIIQPSVMVADIVQIVEEKTIAVIAIRINNIKNMMYKS